ncbi:glycoside hydrolase family 3 C-terminal domain-containing protein [Nocardia sp. NBC_01377]|uniref:glycoside hydrolase family 3 C-terminal domain-containing protein n=1 Tax=Nocardia sp. NBC_01377 TaxID=2903595 RepID=UPI003864BCF1
MVRGIQSRGVGASVKHFAANNQETDRMRVSAEVDERTLREIYLSAFEYIVTTAAPWTVMAAYNRVNGVPATESRFLLTDVLREEWGFEGVVVSDWCAVTDPVAAVVAGVDLEMPTTRGASARTLVEAVGSGNLDQEVLDRAVARMLMLIGNTTNAPSDPVDSAAHHTLARRVAAESAVLLKNEDAVLPLKGHTRIAVIGEFARTPRYQGAGSSQVVPTQIDNTLDSLRTVAGKEIEVSFHPGFTLSGADDALMPQAVQAAATAEVTVLFLGLPDGEESEGFDRRGLELPLAQTRLLTAIGAVTSNVIVVLCNGGVIEVSSWQHHAKAILEMWLPGQAGGSAIADLLMGIANPSGRLAETIPLRLQDTPAHLNFPGSDSSVIYGERLYVGYRYYDAKHMPVSFPFGHGLSYTTFHYTDLQAAVRGTGDDITVYVRLNVTNTGSVRGKDVVQLYVRDIDSSVDRPVRELAAKSISRQENQPRSPSNSTLGVCRSTAPTMAVVCSNRAHSNSQPVPHRAICGSR